MLQGQIRRGVEEYLLNAANEVSSPHPLVVVGCQEEEEEKEKSHFSRPCACFDCDGRWCGVTWLTGFVLWSRSSLHECEYRIDQICHLESSCCFLGAPIIVRRHLLYSRAIVVLVRYEELMHGEGLRVELHTVLRTLDRVPTEKGGGSDSFDGSTAIMDMLAAHIVRINSLQPPPASSNASAPAFSPNSKRHFLVNFVEYLGTLSSAAAAAASSSSGSVACSSTDDLLPLLIVSMVRCSKLTFFSSKMLHRFILFNQL